MTDLHPKKQELFLGFEPEPCWGCLNAVLWDAPSSASKLHPPACRLHVRNCTNLLKTGFIHSFILSSCSQVNRIVVKRKKNLTKIQTTRFQACTPRALQHPKPCPVPRGANPRSSRFSSRFPSQLSHTSRAAGFGCSFEN